MNNKHINATYKLSEKQIGQLHELFQEEWWTNGRMLSPVQFQINIENMIGSPGDVD